MSKKPAKMGRPQKYKKNYAIEVKEYVKNNWQNGASFRKWAIENEIGISTLHMWVEQHQDFLDAKLFCRELEEQWWIDMLMKAAAGNAPEYEETATKYNLKKNGDKTQAEAQYRMVIKKQTKMSVAAIQFALKNLYPEKWKDRQEIDMSTPTSSLESMSDEELHNETKKIEARIAVLRKKHGKST